jgi:hypothetical protein
VEAAMIFDSLFELKGSATINFEITVDHICNQLVKLGNLADILVGTIRNQVADCHVHYANCTFCKSDVIEKSELRLKVKNEKF